VADVSVVLAPLARHAAGGPGPVHRPAWLPAGPASDPGERRYFDALGLQRLGAALALEAEDLPGARAWLVAHDRWLAWSGERPGARRGLSGLGQYHRRTGDRDAARAHAELALGRAGAPRQPLALLAATACSANWAPQPAGTPTRRRNWTRPWRWPTPAPRPRAGGSPSSRWRSCAPRPATGTPHVGAGGGPRHPRAPGGAPALSRAAALAERLAASPPPAAPAALPFG